MSQAQDFVEAGYAVLDLPHPEIVRTAAAKIRDTLRDLTGVPTLELARYHEAKIAEDRHEAILIAATDWFRRERIPQRIIEGNLSAFTAIVGSDIKIERSPFLRLNRPSQKGDNLGFHRDTLYGASPYEMSVIIPFVDIPAEASVGIIRGSHLEPDGAFEIVDAPSRGTHVTKGSKIHKVGFPYAPRVVKEGSGAQPAPIPLAVGQVLVFPLAVIHGSTVNASPITRVSSDCRVANALAPVDRNIQIGDQMVPYYEEPSVMSPLTQCGRRFLALGASE